MASPKPYYHPNQRPGDFRNGDKVEYVCTPGSFDDSTDSTADNLVLAQGTVESSSSTQVIVRRYNPPGHPAAFPHDPQRLRKI